MIEKYMIMCQYESTIEVQYALKQLGYYTLYFALIRSSALYSDRSL